MKNREFLENVARRVQEITGKKTEIKEVEKNNETKLGIVLFESNEINPVFYPDIFETEDEMVNYMTNFKADVKPEVKNIMEIFKNKDQVLKNVKMKVVNRKRNENNRASINLNDELKVQFYINVMENGTVTLTNDQIELLDITTEELLENAKENMKDELSIENLAERIGMPVMQDEFPLYIVSTKNGLYGAGIILINGIKEKLNEKIGGFYLLPSSIHEFIAVPRMMDNDFKGIVEAVNSECVSQEDFLSDSVFYMPADGVLSIV